MQQATGGKQGNKGRRSAQTMLVAQQKAKSDSPRLALRLAAWATCRPGPALALMLGLVLLAAPGILRLELRTDGHALVPPRDPAILADHEIREHFGLRDPIAVVLVSNAPEGIYRHDLLSSVSELTAELAALKGIGEHQVVSLANERRDRVYPGTLNFRPFLDPLPETEEEMQRLRSDIDAADILTGTLVSADRSSTAVVVGVPLSSVGAEVSSAASRQALAQDRVALYRQVRELAEARAPTDVDVLVVGAPVAEALLGLHLLQDLALLLPLSLAVVSLVLWLGCRRLWGVLLGLGEVGACLVFVFGVMGWLGVPVYLSTAVLPVVLTTIGLADEIHVFWHYQSRLRTLPAGRPWRRRVLATLRTMARPVVLTSLTTTLGFLSFLASEIPPVRAFGIFAAVGILFCLAWTLVAIPACLVLIPAERLRRPSKAAASPEQGWLRAWSAILARRRAWVLLTVVLISAVAAAGLNRLQVQDSWIDGFAPGSPFRVATERVNELYHGTHLLLAHLDFPEDPEPLRTGPTAQALEGQGPLDRPELLRAIGDFERHLAAQPGVGAVLGPESHLLMVSYLWLGRRPELRVIPEHRRRVGVLLKRFDEGRGEHRRREILDDQRRRAVLTIYLRDANYQHTARVMSAAQRYVQQHLGPQHGAQLSFAGDVAVSQAMIPAIVRTQVVSLLLAVFGAFLALCVLYRRPIMALLAVLPTAVAVLWVFGTMAWLSIPLGVATSMFCAITLGIGVDYSIHFLERTEGQRGPAAVTRALQGCGPAILADTAAIALGFGLLFLSQVPANARLGLLVALALVSACFLTLGGLAALLVSGRGTTVQRRSATVVAGLEEA